MVYFREAKPCKMYMFTKMELATNFNFMEVPQDYCCLHMLLAPIKEKKVTHQAWIKVFTARDYPNVFPQSVADLGGAKGAVAPPFLEVSGSTKE